MRWFALCARPAASGWSACRLKPAPRRSASAIPLRGRKRCKVLQATGGACEQVSEIEIAQAKAEIGAEGIGCEPASAVTLAGLKKLVKQRLREAGRNRRPGAHRKPAEGSRLHHGIPPRRDFSETPATRMRKRQAESVAPSAGRPRCHSGRRDPNFGAGGEDP